MILVTNTREHTTSTCMYLSDAINNHCFHRTLRKRRSSLWMQKLESDLISDSTASLDLSVTTPSSTGKRDCSYTQLAWKSDLPMMTTHTISNSMRNSAKMTTILELIEKIKCTMHTCFSEHCTRYPTDNVGIKGLKHHATASEYRQTNDFVKTVMYTWHARWNIRTMQKNHARTCITAMVRITVGRMMPDLQGKRIMDISIFCFSHNEMFARVLCKMNDRSGKEWITKKDGTEACMPLTWTRKIIRSLREDVHVSRNVNQRVRVVAQSRRERMVAHDFTDTSFLLLKRTCGRTFFEKNSSLMLSMMW